MTKAAEAGFVAGWQKSGAMPGPLKNFLYSLRGIPKGRSNTLLPGRIGSGMDARLLHYLGGFEGPSIASANSLVDRVKNVAKYSPGIGGDIEGAIKGMVQPESLGLRKLHPLVEARLKQRTMPSIKF